MRRILGLVACTVLGVALGATTGPADAVVPQGAATARVATAPGAQGVVPARLLVQRSHEERVLKLTNRQRRAHGCRSLRTSAPLRKAARTHSVRMARHDTMSHQLPGEPRFGVRINRAGYRGWQMVAENVARGYGSPEEVVRAWMQSPGHRANVLNCGLRDLGVGVVVRRGQLWWTQNFGRR